jgi:VanZ family protein
LSALGVLGSGWYKRRGLVLDVMPAVLALGMMFYFGLLPLQHLPGPEFKLADKVWHLVAFGGLAGLLSRAVTYLGAGIRQAQAISCALSLGFGGLIEVLQSFTPFRAADWADFLADALGVGLAYAGLLVLERGARQSTA